MIKQYPHTYWEESIKNPNISFNTPVKNKEITLYNLQTKAHLITPGQIYSCEDEEFHLLVTGITKSNRDDSNEDAWIYFTMLDPKDYSKVYYEGEDNEDSFRAWNLEEWKLEVDIEESD